MADVRKARVVNGVVLDVYTASDEELAEKLGPILSEIVACAPDVRPGWVDVGGVLVDPTPVPTYRDKRREAYFAALKVDARDDMITVLGDQVTIILEQLAVIVPVEARTPAFEALLSKILAIRAAIPKP